MRTVIFVRHAKSSWSDHGLTDFERPLNKRGEKDAPFMANLIKEMGLNPGVIYSSPANRAYSTAKEFASIIGLQESDIQKEKLIYEYGPRAILNLIAETDDNHNMVMLFGHNPDITSMANFLSDSSFGNVPTCGVVCIDFDINFWAEFGEKKGRLRFYEYPKKYRDE